MKSLRALFLSLLFVGSVHAADTIVCADNDNDGTQTKLKSPGLLDRDCDGQTPPGTGAADINSVSTDTDCDDTLFFSHDKSYGQFGCNASFYRYCEAGTYKTGPGGSTTVANGGQGCTNAQLCECATCYYVNPGSGSDANSGDFTHPLASFAPVTNTNGAVGSKSSFAGQTCIYLMGTTDLTTPISRTAEGGNCDTKIGFDTQSAGPNSSTKNLIARYPGATAKIALSGCDGSVVNPTGCVGGQSFNGCGSIAVNQDNWKVRGFEITAGYGVAVSNKANNGEVFDNYIHDAQGNNNFNLSAIKNGDGNTGARWHHNIINNVYDPGRSAQFDVRQNVWGITLFTGADNIVSNNLVGYNHAPNTVPYAVQGGCLRWKHGTTYAGVASHSDFQNNITYNCELAGALAVSPKQYVHGNLEVNAQICLRVADGGNGTYYIDDIRYQNNTCQTSTDNGFGWRGAAINFGDASSLSGNPANAILVSGNIVDDSANTAYNGTGFAMINIYRPGTDAQYTAMITGGKFQFSGNLYYNSHQAALSSGFDVFGDNSATANGAVVNFTGWNGGTFTLETTGFNENPLFDTDMQAQSTHGVGHGWVIEWPTTSTTTTTLPGGGASGVAAMTRHRLNRARR